MTGLYQPVPVTAFGRRFRSTTEARWAAFFESLSLPYEYEPETVALGVGLGWYMPDFWLPTLYSLGAGPGWWFEVKPGKNAILAGEWLKATHLFDVTGHAAVIATGFGDAPSRHWEPGRISLAIGSGDPPQQLVFEVCSCRAVGLVPPGQWFKHGCDRPQRNYWRLADAYTAGRSFRADRR